MFVAAEPGVEFSKGRKLSSAHHLEVPAETGGELPHLCGQSKGLRAASGGEIEEFCRRKFRVDSAGKSELVPEGEGIVARQGVGPEGEMHSLLKVERNRRDPDAEAGIGSRAEDDCGLGGSNPPGIVSIDLHSVNQQGLRRQGAMSCQPGHRRKTGGTARERPAGGSVQFIGDRPPPLL
jgi:hypothetical protein